MSDRIVLTAAELQSYASRLLHAAGFPVDEADLVAESLVNADLRGHESHGVVRILEYVDKLRRGELVPGAALTIERESTGVLVADACFGAGQIQCRELLRRLLDKARESGVASGTLRNCGHVGRLGEWVELAAEAGMIALMTVNDNGAELCVAPPNGLEARLGTNPLAIAVPTSGSPLLLDMSTSVVASGKVTVERLAGRACPNGWLQDADGTPSTDSGELDKHPPGALLPAGGYKGFGLGLLLDCLAGGLSGGNCPSAEAESESTNNVWMLVLDPQHFAGVGHLQSTVESLIGFVRSSRTKATAERIQLPNDRSQATLAKRSAEGIPIDEGLWSALNNLAKTLEVSDAE